MENQNNYPQQNGGTGYEGGQQYYPPQPPQPQYVQEQQQYYPQSPQPPQQPAPKKNNVLIIAIAAVLIVAIIAGVVVFLVMRNDKQNDGDKDNKKESVSASQDAGENTTASGSGDNDSSAAVTSYTTPDDVEKAFETALLNGDSAAVDRLMFKYASEINELLYSKSESDTDFKVVDPTLDYSSDDVSEMISSFDEMISDSDKNSITFDHYFRYDLYGTYDINDDYSLNLYPGEIEDELEALNDYANEVYSKHNESTEILNYVQSVITYGEYGEIEIGMLITTEGCFILAVDM
ncbi:MAG: hypothetical protein E7571_07685 [Ruminococcaceae bacterium]|nr:hypothetical protein [Oscillospiraceae bacterium]